MKQRQIDLYDEDRVASISADVGQAIDAATLGSGSWNDVPAALSNVFPGSFGGLSTMNFPEKKLNFLSLRNVDPAFVDSFNEHFAYINPWTAYWMSVRSGAVAASEEVFPARSFADSEFYNDWLVPQKDVEAAVGMKLVGDRQEQVQLILHFPLSLSGRYEKAAVEVMTRVRGNLERSIDFARRVRLGAEGAVAEAALVERSRCAAFVVEGDRRVREANRMAMQLFSSGRAVSVRNDRCFLADRKADALFGSMLEGLTMVKPTAGSPISVNTAAGAWQVTLAPLSQRSTSPIAFSLLGPRPMVLVLVTDLRAAIEKADLSALATSFELTPSEISFCKRLMLGESVSDAAGRLGISVETARTRLKTIFRKSGTSRQGQLMLLLSRLG